MSYFDGWETRLTSPSTVHSGVTADIVNYSPTHSPAVYNNTASAWVMLALAGAGQNHAQAGWLEFGDRSRFTFWEWTDSTATGSFRRRLRPPLPGSSRYAVVYNNSPGQFSFEVNGAVMDTVTTNPTFVPDQAQKYGETKSQASQMPGGTLGTEVFDAASVRVNGSWAPLNGLTFALRQLPNGTVQDVGFFHSRRVSNSRLDRRQGMPDLTTTPAAARSVGRKASGFAVLCACLALVAFTVARQGDDAHSLRLAADLPEVPR